MGASHNSEMSAGARGCRLSSVHPSAAPHPTTPTIAVRDLSLVMAVRPRLGDSGSNASPCVLHPTRRAMPLNTHGDGSRHIEGAVSARCVASRSGPALVAWSATRCFVPMIQSFRHKGLRRFFESGTMTGIQPHHAKRLRMQLAAIETAHSINDMDIPGFRLRPSQGPSAWTVGDLVETRPTTAQRAVVPRGGPRQNPDRKNRKKLSSSVDCNRRTRYSVNPRVVICVSLCCGKMGIDCRSIDIPAELTP